MLRSWLAKLLARSQPVAPLSPGGPFCAIGDIHGRFDLLTRLLTKLEPELQVICVGDYVDRGEHSAEVLRFLQAHPEITCLMGNHEQMLLSFLDDPKAAGPRWLRYGGLQTLASFGVAGVSDTSQGADLEKACEALTAAMGEDLITWLRRLPLSWQSGNIFVTHAGCDPAVPVDEQSASHLLWGHPEFFKMPLQDGNWVLHGHTIVDAPSAEAGRISIDTGAFATGRLTAAVVKGQAVEFLQA